MHLLLCHQVIIMANIIFSEFFIEHFHYYSSEMGSYLGAVVVYWTAGRWVMRSNPACSHVWACSNFGSCMCEQWIYFTRIMNTMFTFPSTMINWILLYCFFSLCCVLFLLWYGIVSCISPRVIFTGTGAIIWLPQCQWSNPQGYGVITSYESAHKFTKNIHCI